MYKEGETFLPTEILMKDGRTSTPTLLLESDLISLMDKNGIGTDATIVEHIKTILNRGYAIKVNNNLQFKPTPLGLALVERYDNMGIFLAKPHLGTQMERYCKAIVLGTKEKRIVVDSCLRHMKQIFQDVVARANVLEDAVGRHFD